MTTSDAVAFFGSATKLARALGIKPAAISQWGENVPQPRVWQLQVMKPSWFRKPKPTAPEAA